MIKNCPEISDSPDVILENLQKLVWIANGQVKASKNSINRLIAMKYLKNQGYFKQN